MRVLWFANILNMILGPCFIFGIGPFPQLGVTGAAVATTIGRGCGVIYQIVELSRQRGWIAIKRSHLRLDFPLLRRVWNLSTTATLQILIGTTSWIGIVRVLASFGSAAVAGNTIGFRIILFAILPSEGVANAAATMVGQNLGADNPDRAARAAWLAAFYNMLFLGAIGAFFILFPRQIVSVFTNDAAVATYAASCLRTVAYGFLFYAYGMVLTNSLNGAGDTWTPTVINLGIFWIFEIPLAYGLAHRTQLGPYGVFWAMTIAYSALAVVSGIVFARGRWRHKRV
jgi:putative MATE family efflux protein